MTATIITAGDVVQPGFGISSGNDGTVVIQSGPNGAKVNALRITADGTPTFSKPPVNTGTVSMVRLNTGNGNGSTNTVIRRFTNVVTNQGSDITYADSATAGASFTINTAGIYTISYTDAFSTQVHFGLSKNSSQLTTTIINITVTDRLSSAFTSAANNESFCGWTGPLAVGDVIRPHGDGGANAAVAAMTQFTITKVA